MAAMCGLRLLCRLRSGSVSFCPIASTFAGAARRGHPRACPCPAYGSSEVPYLTEAPIGAASDAGGAQSTDHSGMGTAERTSRGWRLAGDGEPPIELVAIVGWSQQTNYDLVDEWLERGIPAVLLSPREATSMLAPGDTALARLDVLPTLDGIEDGLDELEELSHRGVRLLNSPSAIVGAHDKLLTAQRLVAARLPHPKTVHLPREGAPLGLRPPLVVKPRFGSWGIDVFRCDSEHELETVVRAIRDRPWFRRHGALLQELVPSTGATSDSSSQVGGSSAASSGSPRPASGGRTSRSERHGSP
jgi:hypothetical protein